MILAKGNIKLYAGDGVTPTEGFTLITDATEITWTGRTFETEDVTTHNDTNKFREMATTLYSNGTIDFTLLYDPSNTNHALLRTLNLSGAENNFRLKIEGGILYEGFGAYVAQWVPVMEIGGIFKAQVQLLINGPMTTVS